jgi:transcription termination/antitermination protein NusG
MAAAAERDAGRSWYVLQVAPNRERVAKAFFSPTDSEIYEAGCVSGRLMAHLMARKFEPYVPMMREKRTRGIVRRKIVVEKPIFPGYAFIQLNFQADQHRLHLIRLAPGVIDFVKNADGDCAIVPDHEMALIGRIEAAALVPRAKASPFEVGEVVRISEGPFSGFNGDIFELTDSERIGLLVNIFGRKTPIRLDEDQLEKL